MILPCKSTCKDCQHKNECKYLDYESLYYLHDFALVKKSELQEKGIKNLTDHSGGFLVVPMVVLKPKSRQKLISVLTEISSHNKLKRQINIKTLSDIFDVSIEQIKNRLKYLVSKGYIKGFKTKKSRSSVRTYYSTNENISEDINDLSETIKFWSGIFSNRFRVKPRIDAKDIGALKLVLKEYSKEEVRFFMKAFLMDDDQFIKHSGYKIQFMPGRINYYITNNKVANQSAQQKTKITENQLSRYIEGKNRGKWTGKEEWAKDYEEEVLKRANQGNVDSTKEPDTEGLQEM